jgi:ISXO2-like transposase domain
MWAASSAGEYVWETIHTNTIEGYWSRLKNSIRGTHIHVSRKHLWKYVSEFSFRYNMRKQPEVMFGRLVEAFAQPRLKES